MCCEVHLFVAMQMHSSNGNGYTFIIMSCGLRSEPKNDKLCIWLSWDALIILPPLHPHGEFMGQSPNSFDWPQHRIQIAHCFSSVAVYVCHGLVLLFFLTIIFCLKTHDVFMHVSAPELKASWKISKFRFLLCDCSKHTRESVCLQPVIVSLKLSEQFVNTPLGDVLQHDVLLFFLL